MSSPEEDPDPWCTSPDEPEDDVIVVQGSTEDE